MLKAGIIGAGYIGEFHARGYASLPDVKLALWLIVTLPALKKWLNNSRPGLRLTLTR
jgi:predicted dehydrogenase